MTKPLTFKSEALRVGFVPLLDCAPLVMAQELGLFARYGLRVKLVRELGWATVRDKIIYGELEASHALAAMPIVARLGFGSVPCHCLTGLVLNLHGNAITLSHELWRRGIRDGHALGELVRRSRKEKAFTFGVVSTYSAHRHLLRRWLAVHRIDADRDVRLVVVPPPQMPASLKAGHLDGFCAGEPWNSVAAASRAGWAVAAGVDLDPGHPEKVLMVRRDFAEHRTEEHVALITALLRACEFCSQAAHRPEVARTLARPEYVGVPAELLARSLAGELDWNGAGIRPVRDYCLFHGEGVNDPSPDKAAWTLSLIRSIEPRSDLSAVTPALGRQAFRSDIYDQATRLLGEAPQPETPHYDELVHA